MSLDEMLQGFQPEDVPADVYDADKFPPRFQPGQRVRFIFKFEDETQKPAITLSDDKKTVRLAYQAEAVATITKEGEQPVRATSSGNQPSLRFQQVDSRSFKNADGTQVPSSLHKLFRALVGREQAKLTGTDPRLIIAKLRELDGRESFEATVGWKLYNADTQTEYSTGTKKSREYEKQDGSTAYYEPWPLDENGQPSRTIEGEYPRDFVNNCIEKKVAKTETVGA